ncbi:RF-1 domain-containing protein [Kalaharituber pfeilii]|nr:RF-1 domain-containing protein [Kalaharituber pfeilii]
MFRLFVLDLRNGFQSNLSFSHLEKFKNIVNKTNSAVQLHHIPTGIVVKSQATRSREQNRKIARQLLAEKLEEMEKGGESRASMKRDEKRKKKDRMARRAKKKYALLEEEKRKAAGLPGDSEGGLPEDAEGGELDGGGEGERIRLGEGAYGEEVEVFEDDDGDWDDDEVWGGDEEVEDQVQKGKNNKRKSSKSHRPASTLGQREVEDELLHQVEEEVELLRLANDFTASETQVVGLGRDEERAVIKEVKWKNADDDEWSWGDEKKEVGQMEEKDNGGDRGYAADDGHGNEIKDGKRDGKGKGKKKR